MTGACSQGGTFMTEPSQPKKPTRGVFAAIMSRDGESNLPVTFLLQRADEKYRGTWEYPGGKVQDGETDEECLVRRVREETGLTIRPLRQISQELTLPPGAIAPQGDDAVVYLCDVLSDDIWSFPTDDHLSGGWYGLASIFNGEIKIITNPTSKGYVGRMAKMILAGFAAHQTSNP